MLLAFYCLLVLLQCHHLVGKRIPTSKDLSEQYERCPSSMFYTSLQTCQIFPPTPSNKSEFNLKNLKNTVLPFQSPWLTLGVKDGMRDRCFFIKEFGDLGGGGRCCQAGAKHPWRTSVRLLIGALRLVYVDYLPCCMCANHKLGREIKWGAWLNNSQKMESRLPGGSCSRWLE
jgi:hypothetical protein